MLNAYPLANLCIARVVQWYDWKCVGVCVTVNIKYVKRLSAEVRYAQRRVGSAVCGAGRRSRSHGYQIKPINQQTVRHNVAPPAPDSFYCEDTFGCVN